MAPKTSSAVILNFVIYAMIFLTVWAQEDVEKINVFETDIEVPEECRKLYKKIKDSKETESYCPYMPKVLPQQSIDTHVQNIQQKGFPTQKIRPTSSVNTMFKEDYCKEEQKKNCCTKSAIHQPYFAVSEGTLKMVIQSKFFQQTIKVTKCANDNSCFGDFHLENLGYQTQCKTDYATTKLYVYNSVRNTTEPVPVTFPVSCSCSITYLTPKNSEELMNLSDDFDININI